MDKKNSAKLEELKVEYLKKIPGKIAEIESLWSFLKEKWNVDAATALMRAAHNLRGTSGTYGYMEISQTAEKIESSIGSVLEKLKNNTALNPNEKEESINKMNFLITQLNSFKIKLSPS